MKFPLSEIVNECQERVQVKKIFTCTFQNLSRALIEWEGDWLNRELGSAPKYL